LAKLGVNGAAAAQIAAHRSRLAKDRRDEEALKVEWRQRADASDIKVDGITANALRHGRLWRQSDAATLMENVRVTVAHATERDAVPDRRELETFTLQHTMGRSILEHVRGAVESHRDDGKLIAIALGHRHPIGSFTTPEMAALERNNVAVMRESQGKASAIAEAEKVRRWAARRGLAPDQTAAAEVTLSTRDWLSAVDGRAGAAKTTTVGAIREFAQEQDYFVRGVAPASGSVKALTEAGVLSRAVGREQLKATALEHLSVVD
jgi:AAA domain-containing protein